jgi:hypothetical protein
LPNQTYGEKLADAAREYRRAQKLADEFDATKREAERNYRTAIAVANTAWAVVADLVRGGE